MTASKAMALPGRPPATTAPNLLHFQLYSDLFVNNGTANYAEKMTALGNKVFLYSFDYYNPRSLGLLSLRAPFRGRHFQWIELYAPFQLPPTVPS